MRLGRRRIVDVKRRTNPEIHENIGGNGTYDPRRVLYLSREG